MQAYDHVLQAISNPLRLERNDEKRKAREMRGEQMCKRNVLIEKEEVESYKAILFRNTS